MENSSQISDQTVETQTKRKVLWRGDILTKTYLEACIEEVTASGRLGNSLKPHSWLKVGDILRKTHHFEVDARQMRSRCDYLKSRYFAWCQLKSKTKNHYDPATNSFDFTDEEWEQHAKVHSLLILM